MSRGDSRGFYRSNRQMPGRDDYRLQRELCRQSDGRSQRRRKMESAAGALGLVGILAGCGGRSAEPVAVARANPAYSNPFEEELIGAGFKPAQPDFEVMPGTSYYVNNTGEVIVVARVTGSSEYLARATASHRARKSAVAVSGEMNPTDSVEGDAVREAAARFEIRIDGTKTKAHEEQHTVYSRARVSLSRMPEARQKYFMESAGFVYTGPVAVAVAPVAGADPAAVVAPGTAAVAGADPAAVVAPGTAAVAGADPAAVVAPGTAAVAGADPAAAVAPGTAAVAPGADPAAVVAPGIAPGADPAAVVAPGTAPVAGADPAAVVAGAPAEPDNLAAVVSKEDDATSPYVVAGSAATLGVVGGLLIAMVYSRFSGGRSGKKKKA